MLYGLPGGRQGRAGAHSRAAMAAALLLPPRVAGSTPRRGPGLQQPAPPRSPAPQVLHHADTTTRHGVQPHHLPCPGKALLARQRPQLTPAGRRRRHRHTIFVAAINTPGPPCRPAPPLQHRLQVTQCLGGLAQLPWYIVVARPSGSVAAYPRQQDLVAFEIPPGVFIKMEQGTWHAGPLFDNADHQDYYNLELNDTNQVCVCVCVWVCARRGGGGGAGGCVDGGGQGVRGKRVQTQHCAGPSLLMPCGLGTLRPQVDHNAHDYLQQDGLVFELHAAASK